ncbi:hypothetical protein RIF29_25778 [Crotalaria pallida]|uniref:Uncharacterized protein n=1 Tax=Crotalaria pallida TaxID=3830 RepID=A0AAN9HXQ2_CROPI
MEEQHLDLGKATPTGVSMAQYLSDHAEDVYSMVYNEAKEERKAAKEVVLHARFKMVTLEDTQKELLNLKEDKVVLCSALETIEAKVLKHKKEAAKNLYNWHKTDESFFLYAT